MSNVFAGMEALDEQVTEDRIDLSEVLFDVIEDESAINEMNAEITSMEVAEENFSIAFKQLKALHRSIDEFGISKGVILAVDPDRYLEKNGLIPSYESLNDLPTKDENAEIALEGIGDKIKEYWNKIINFIKSIWNKIKNLFSHVSNASKSSEKSIKSYIEAIKDKEFDDDKVKEKKFKLPKSDDFIKAMDYFSNKIQSILDESLKDIDKVLNLFYEKDILDNQEDCRNIYFKFKKDNNIHGSYLGVEATLTNKAPIWKSSEKYIFNNIKEDTLIKHNYNDVNKVIDILNKSIKIIKSNKDIEKQLKNLDNIQQEFEEEIKDFISGTDKKYQKDYNDRFKLINQYITFNRTTLVKMINLYTKIYKTAIALGNAAKSVVE